jgi:hypothetical protein
MMGSFARYSYKIGYRKIPGEHLSGKEEKWDVL